MHGAVEVAELIGALLVLAGLSLVVLAGRRRWLARQGGTFECSLRLNSATPGSGWVLGVGRYHDGMLQWFRFFSYAWRPRKEFLRSAVRVLETRDPTVSEAVALYAEQRIVSFEVVGADEANEQWDLAMSAGSMTGLLSWLEAAPPGLNRLH
ncbi:DUF2550 domain-containing protein [uncultured Friedmanniella sp.]|uniref:DUF2550 domain-containing protein n=1 Tax=uncultured Friedmanniella sp. TaxID=335381 RepID=UPI0035CAF256